jgi:hypothetical protein
MAIAQLTPQLPVADAFRAEYLTYYRMLPLAERFAAALTRRREPGVEAILVRHA